MCYFTISGLREAPFTDIAMHSIAKLSLVWVLKENIVSTPVERYSLVNVSMKSYFKVVYKQSTINNKKNAYHLQFLNNTSTTLTSQSLFLFTSS